MSTRMATLVVLEEGIGRDGENVLVLLDGDTEPDWRIPSWVYRQDGFNPHDWVLVEPVSTGRGY